jgi:hypothetical protein
MFEEKLDENLFKFQVTFKTFLFLQQNSLNTLETEFCKKKV